MKNIQLSLALLCIFGLCLAACNDNPKGQDKGPIQLGAIYSQSGPLADLDIPSARGAQLAVSQINAAGGVLGRQIALVQKDGKSDAQVVAKKIKEIMEIAPDAPAIFGISDSDMALAAAIEAKSANRMFLTSGATSPLLPEQVPDYLYLACFGDNVQAAAAAEWAYAELNARTVAVLYDSTETYTKLLHGYFIDRFESLGGQVLSVVGYNPDAFGQLGQGLPDADFIFLSAEVASQALPVIQQLRQMGKNMPIVGGDGYDAEDVWENNPDIEKVFYSTHAYLGEDNPNNLVHQFREAYKEAYNDNLPDAFAALGYDAANLLVAAIKQAGSVNPDSVRLTLSQLQNIPGVTGTISFTDGKQIPEKSVSMIEVKGGSRIFLKEVIPVVIPNP